jgi:L-asparaginase
MAFAPDPKDSDVTEITIMTTGGTIEKIYDEFDGALENRESIIMQKILSRLRLPYTYLYVTAIMTKDSLFMTEDDRTQIIEAIKHELTLKRPVVILHGTDTMSVTAEKCLREIPHPAYPIIFTGAMRPLGFEESDAPQNVTEALLAAKLMAPGVYISFHNRVFPLPNVRKNKQRGSFESF